jgi:hypothetical protein
MKAAAVVGFILIVLGVLGLVLGGFSFTQKEKVFDIGPVEATADDREHVGVPPLVGVLAIVGGIALVAASARRA